MSKLAIAALVGASAVLGHLPVQEAVDSTHSEPMKIIDVCDYDQEHAIYAKLDSKTDVDVYELVVPEESKDFFIHVALPVLPFDKAEVVEPEDRRRSFRQRFPFELFKGYFRFNKKEESKYPKCPGNDARPIIAVVGPGIPTDVGRSRWFAAHQNGCGNGRNRLPFYVAEDEGVVLTEFIEDFPYYEDFESGFTVVGEKKFVDLKKGTYKFYVWDAQGRTGDYLAVFGRNEDCYAGEGRGYGPVGVACRWLVKEEFHANCGARPEIPACCCFLPPGEGVCPEREALEEFCPAFRIGGKPLPFTLYSRDGELIDNDCADDESFISCADLVADKGCDAAPFTPEGAPSFVTVTVSETCKKTCNACGAEEPVAEEPVAEEPVAEEPVAEEPVAEDPGCVDSENDFFTCADLVADIGCDAAPFTPEGAPAFVKVVVADTCKKTCERC